MEPQQAFSTREINEACNPVHYYVVNFMDNLICCFEVAASAAGSRPHGVLAPGGEKSILVGLGGTREAVTFFLAMKQQAQHQQPQSTLLNCQM